MTALHTSETVSAAALEILFRPNSVAVVGASTNPVKVSGRPIKLLQRAKFPGPVYPVNANASEVQGLKAYPSVRAIPGPVDLAVICVPARQVLDAADDCIAKGVKVLVIFSSGFAEVDAEGRAMQEQLRARTAAAGVRVLGPNCLGAFNFHHHYFATFASVFDNSWPLEGRIAMCGQSGAYSAYIYALAHTLGLGISHFATTGNESDIDVAECIAYLAQDDGTDVIITSFEGCKNGPRLMAALAMAHERRKPIVAMKVGATPIGTAAAAAHTGSIAGDDAVFDSVLRRYNVYRAYSIEEMLDVAYACAATRHMPQGHRLGIFSVSGGIAVMMADAAHNYGFEMLPLPLAAQRRIRELIPFASGLNPVDPTGQILSDLSLFDRIFDITLEAGTFDAMTVFMGDIARNPQYAKPMMEILIAKQRSHADLPFFVAMMVTPALRADLFAAGMSAFEHPVRTIRAAAALTRLARGFAKPVPTPPPVAKAGAGRRPLPRDAFAARQVLREAGIPMAEARRAVTATAAAAAAQELGYPVLLLAPEPPAPATALAMAPGIPLANAVAVKRAFAALQGSAGNGGGVLVMAAAPAGVQVSIGAKRDSVFGPMVTLGMSGLGMEVYNDVVHRVAPLGETEALDMIAELRAGAYLRQAAGAEALQHLAQALARLSVLATAHGDEFDRIAVDPLVLTPQGVVGLSARLALRDPGAR